jgi:hypothetical protein
LRNTIICDANAALRMLYVFTEEALHGRRPPQFTKVNLIGLMHAADETPTS